MREKKIKKIAEIIGKGISVKENEKIIKNKDDKYLTDLVKVYHQMEMCCL